MRAFEREREKKMIAHAFPVFTECSQDSLSQLMQVRRDEEQRRRSHSDAEQQCIKASWIVSSCAAGL